MAVTHSSTNLQDRTVAETFSSLSDVESGYVSAVIAVTVVAVILLIYSIISTILLIKERRR